MKSADLSAIERKVVDRVELDAAEYFGCLDPARVVLVQVIANPYSTVLKIEISISGSSQVVYAKIPHTNRDNRRILQKRLQTEFDVMERVSKKSKCQRYGVAKPFAIYSDFPAVVTLAAPGRPLRNELSRGARLVALPIQRKTLLLCTEACGQWLREFQEYSFVELEAFDTDELLEYCEIRIKLLFDHPGHGFSSKLAEDILYSLRKLAEGVDPSCHRIVGRHNDFASHNIVADGSAVKIIDFSMFDNGSYVYDPCNFWLDIEILKLDNTYSSRFLGELQRAFTFGYGDLDTAAPEFRLARVRYSLNRLLTSLTSQATSRFEKRYRCRVIDFLSDFLVNFNR